MGNYVNENIKAVMFNLGYLPGSDHSVSTKADTTISAIEKSMELLVTGGIITIEFIMERTMGQKRKKKVLDFLKTVDQKKFAVMKTEFINQRNCPPILVCIEKL